MKRIIALVALAALLLFGFFYEVHAAPVSWDFAGGVLQPLQSAWAAVVKGDHFVATSTTPSLFPYASTTALSATSLCLSTDCRTVWPSAGVYTATYPVTLTGSAFGLAFGTTTSNTWAGTQTFTNTPILGALSGLVGANNGALYNVSTSSLNANITGNAGTATALQNSRNINGVAFNGTADITVTAAAGTLTGTTLASNVVSSSLTSVGTLGSLNVSGLSTFTNASTTAFTNSGTTWLTGLTNALLSTDANGKVVATTSLGANITVPITNLTGTLGIANGGTGTTTGGVTNGVEYYDGTKLTNGAGFIYNGTQVAIGTTTPNGTLDVYGTAPSTGLTSNPNFQIGSAATSIQLDLGTYTGGYGFIQSKSSANAAQPLLINPNGGKVGIGSLNPQTTLDVLGTASSTNFYANNGNNNTPAFTFAGDTNTGIYESAADTLDFATNGTKRIEIDSVGNIGLGSSANSAFNVYVAGGAASSTSNQAGLRVSANFSGSQGGIGSIYGSWTDVLANPSAGTWSNVNGNLTQAFFSGTGGSTVSNLTGVFARTGISGTSPTGTISNGNGFVVDSPTNQATTPSVTIGSQTGLQVRNQNGTSGYTPTSGAGIAVLSQTGATNNQDIVFGQGTLPTGNYGLYQGDSYQNYFKGNVGIGSTTPVATLGVQGNGLFSGNVSLANLTATGTLNVAGQTTLASTLTLTPLATPAGTFIAADATGKLIATTTPSGGSTPGGSTQGVNWATAAVLAGTPTYSNGSSGVGATLTEVGSGALSVDGGSPAASDRVLVKNQASAFQNGIYTVTATGSGIASYVLTRSSDYNTATLITPGITTYVLSGTANTDTQWAVSYTSPLTIGTTNLVYTELAGGGATVASVSNSDGTLTISPTTGAVVASLALSHANSWGALQTFNSGITTAGTVTLGSLSGFLKATAGVVSTALVNLASDVTGILPIANGGTATTTPDYLWDGLSAIPRGQSYVQSAVASASSGYTTIYTVPAGKRAYLMMFGIYNPTAGGIQEQVDILTGGNHQLISTISNLGSHTSTNVISNIFLEPGQSISASSTIAGLSYTPKIIQFDNSTNALPFFTASTTITGANTYINLYTAPSGVSATNVFLGSPNNANNSSVVCFNSNTTTQTFAPYIKLSGGAEFQIAATTSINGSSNATVGPMYDLSAGDSIQLMASASNIFCLQDILLNT